MQIIGGGTESNFAKFGGAKVMHSPFSQTLVGLNCDLAIKCITNLQNLVGLINRNLFLQKPGRAIALLPIHVPPPDLHSILLFYIT